jgi:hypothetical protein
MEGLAGRLTGSFSNCPPCDTISRWYASAVNGPVWAIRGSLHTDLCGDFVGAIAISGGAEEVEGAGKLKLFKHRLHILHSFIHLHMPILFYVSSHILIETYYIVIGIP